LQRRINIVAYNNFDEFQQSNIGLAIEWQSTGGITKLVNNKMLVYFDGNHENLRRQIRQGLAKVLLDNVLFGDDLGEFAANQALLDLPKCSRTDTLNMRRKTGHQRWMMSRSVCFQANTLALPACI
jgi:hypothetical protein